MKSTSQLGSPFKNTGTVLKRLEIGALVDLVADGNSVRRTKPAPDLFLHAAQELNVPPAFCAVVEDAGAGIDVIGCWDVGDWAGTSRARRSRPPALRQP